MRLYLNGILVSQGVTSVRPFGALDPASNPGVGIGSHGGYPSTPHKFLFNGLIDELKLYNHALSQADVLANFNATKGSLQPVISISDSSGVEGQPVSFTVTIAPWPTTVTVDFSTANDTAIAGSDYVSNSGSITFAPGIASRTIDVQTLDDVVGERTESFLINLSNAVGAVVADGQGAGTIFDDEIPPTKFFVVDDASANKTFEYTATGSSIENYSLGSGNTATRGAASIAANASSSLISATICSR